MKTVSLLNLPFLTVSSLGGSLYIHKRDFLLISIILTRTLIHLYVEI